MFTYKCELQKVITAKTKFKFDLSKNQPPHSDDCRPSERKSCDEKIISVHTSDSWRVRFHSYCSLQPSL